MFKNLKFFQDGKTALHVAAAHGRVETVAALTLNGADVTAQDHVRFFTKILNFDQIIQCLSLLVFILFKGPFTLAEFDAATCIRCL